MALLQKSVVTWWGQQAIAIPLITGLIAGSFCAVGLFVGDRGPPGLPLFTAISGGVFLASIASFFVLKRWLQMSVSIVEMDGQLVLELDDRNNSLVVPNPRLRFGWNEVPGAKGIPMTELCVVVCDEEGVPQVLFKEVWGAAYGSPRGWKTPFDPQADCKQYSPSGRSFLTEFVDILVPERL